MKDILFKTEDWVFSYRVAGVCVKNGKVLLQKPVYENAYAIPGGHVSFGETNEQTLVREYKEELNADIKVNGLKWVGEHFFPWGKKPCHQICLYYNIEIIDEHTPKDGSFMGEDDVDGLSTKLEFHWVDIDKLKELEVYPVEITELLSRENEGVVHFVYKE